MEAKEGVDIQAENATYATITLQNFFRMYTKLSGMSGTALTEAEDLTRFTRLTLLQSLLILTIVLVSTLI